MTSPASTTPRRLGMKMKAKNNRAKVVRMTEEEKTAMKKTTVDIRSYMQKTGDRVLEDNMLGPKYAPSMCHMLSMSRVKQLIMKAEGMKKVPGSRDDDDKVSPTVHGIDMFVVKDTGADVCVKKPVMKPVVGGVADDVISSGLSDKPGDRTKPEMKKLSSCMGSSHVADRKPGQPAEARGSGLQSKIHYFEKKREGGSDIVRSGNLTGNTTLGGPRKFFTDRDRI